MPPPFNYLHVLFLKPLDPRTPTTATSKLLTCTLKLASYSNINMFANGTNINKLAAVAFLIAGI